MIILKKSIGEILKEHRINANISVKQISEQLIAKGFKASEKTIYSWESNNSHPTPDALLTMCKAYGITDVLSAFSNIETGYDKPSKSEWELIKKYRLLDKHGIKTVNYVLNSEIERVEAFSKLMTQTAHPSATVELSTNHIHSGRIIDYYRSVSAGNGQVIFDDVYSERIPIPDIPEYRRVAYAVKVSGNSMEPLYYDEDILLIEPTCEVDVGEIGIFNVDGQAYVKKLGDGELISLNKGYGNISLEENSRCMGRVVDKLIV